MSSIESEPPVPPVAAIGNLAFEDVAGGGGTPIRGIPARARSERAARLLAYAALILISLIFFVPFLWTISTSLKPLPETAYFSLLPHHWTTHAYHDVWTKYDFARYIENSAGLSLAITALTVVLASLGGYAFARLRFPGRELLFFAVLATLMVPDQLRFVPIYELLVKWRLINTYTGYVLVKLGLATSLFLMRQYFLTIPRDLEEAAKLDGAGYFKTFWRVMLPLAGPALAAVTILEFQGAWNDFFWASLLLQSPDHYTIQIGLVQFVFQYDTLWPLLMAGSVIAVVPIVAIYLVFQRYFVAGVASTGVKG
ncbi:MAG: multiple sugar transport system permease protein [Actinomycetota bacterium]